MTAVDLPPKTEPPLLGMVEKLREEFPPEAVGKLPRGRSKTGRDGKCLPTPEGDAPPGQDFYCGGWHKLPAVHLDYVGHAAVTIRLVETDPLWNWEPLVVDEHGRPVFEYDGSAPVGLWIRLTIGGVTRLGYGSCNRGQNDAEKVLIGDAIRNAAMRFGVATEMWVKGHAEEHDADTADTPTATTSAAQPTPSAAPTPASPEQLDALRERIAALSETAQSALAAEWSDLVREKQLTPLAHLNQPAGVEVASALIATYETVPEPDEPTTEDDVDATAAAAEQLRDALAATPVDTADVTTTDYPPDEEIGPMAECLDCRYRRPVAAEDGPTWHKAGCPGIPT